MIAEISMLLGTISQDLEHQMLSFKTRLLSWQYGTIGLFMLLPKLASVIWTYLEDTSAFSQEMTQFNLAAAATGILMLVLLNWIQIRWVKLIICLLSLAPYIGFIEAKLVPSFRENPTPRYSTVYYIILLSTSANHWLMSCIMNQEHLIFTIVLSLDKLYLIARLYLETESDKMFQHAKAMIYFTLEIFFLYYARSLTTQFFKNLIDRERHESELVGLLDLTAQSPVYLFKIDQSKIEDVWARDSDDATPLRGHLLELRDAFSSFEVEVFHGGSAEKKQVSSGQVLAMLDDIKYDSKSSIAVHMKQKPVSQEDLATLTEEDSTKEFLKGHIFSCSYEGKSALEVVLGICGEILSAEVNLNKFKFTLKDVNNNSILNHEEFKVFDISLMIQKVDQQPFFAISIMDLSKRVISEEEYETKPKGDIAISSVVHDMRAPLQAILGCSENLIYKLQKQFSHDTSSIEACKRIKAYCSHLDQLANDILDSTKINNSKLVLNVSEFNMAMVVEECIDLAKTIQNANKLQLEYYGPALLIVRTDKHRVKRVLMNLLSNSVKNTTKGRVFVSVKDDATNLLSVTVSDTGAGISKEAQRFLFNPFNQYADSQNVQCVGLGLATAREMVGRLGPKKAIEVTSEVGQGSSFCFTLYRNIESTTKENVCLHLVSLPNIKWKQSKLHKPGFPSRGRERASTMIMGAPQEMDLQPAIPSDRDISKSPMLSQHPSPNQAHLRATKSRGKMQPMSKYLDVSDKNSVNWKDDLEQDFGGSEDSKKFRKIKRAPSITALTSSIHQAKHDLKVVFSAGQKIRVMILDDDLFNQEIIETFLRRYFEENGGTDQDFDLKTSSSCEEAIDIVKSDAEAGLAYSLILTDLNLGEGKNGIEFASLVGKVHSERNLKVPYFILASGTELGAQLSETEFSDCLVKPFTYEQFAAALNRWLEGSDCFQ